MFNQSFFPKTTQFMKAGCNEHAYKEATCHRCAQYKRGGAPGVWGKSDHDDSTLAFRNRCGTPRRFDTDRIEG